MELSADEVLKAVCACVCVWVRLPYREREREIHSRWWNDEVGFTGTLNIPRDVCREKFFLDCEASMFPFYPIPPSPLSLAISLPFFWSLSSPAATLRTLHMSLFLTQWPDHFYFSVYFLSHQGLFSEQGSFRVMNKRSSGNVNKNVHSKLSLIMFSAQKCYLYIVNEPFLLKHFSWMFIYHFFKH